MRSLNKNTTFVLMSTVGFTQHEWSPCSLFSNFDFILLLSSIPAGSGVGEVDADVVLEPDYFGERVAAMRDADQRHRLPQPDRLALDVALDFGRAGGICKSRLNVVLSLL